MSKWASPYRIGRHGTRQGGPDFFWQKVLPKFGCSDWDEVRGATLLCHCPPEWDCHGDVLCAEADGKAKGIDQLKASVNTDEEVRFFTGRADEDEVMLDYIEDGLPWRVPEE